MFFLIFRCKNVKKYCRLLIPNSFSASLRNIKITPNTRWIQNGITVAGDHGRGENLNRLSDPLGLCVDDDQKVYVAEYANHRIMAWQSGATTGQIMASGNDEGDRNDQLYRPVNVILDEETDSLIINDSYNRRVVRWLRRSGSSGQ